MPAQVITDVAIAAIRKVIYSLVVISLPIIQKPHPWAFGI
jgi:energy-converting hydrogenase Eha subunit A